MTANSRFRIFKERTGYSNMKLADMFGVDVSDISCWYNGARSLPGDIQQTLARFEAEYEQEQKVAR